MTLINLYCDESGHLENDRINVMVLGVLSCPASQVASTARALRRIKQKHGMGHGNPAAFEVKWSKVSSGGSDFYREYLDYFFDSPDLEFRALVADKGTLKHAAFEQSHDDWYYKMFYQALEPVIAPENTYNVYLDIKDTLSQRKVQDLRKVLSYRHHDFEQTVVRRVQHVRSDEVEHIQLADLLIGAVAYRNRHLRGNRGKEHLVARFRERSGLGLLHTTARTRPKVNLFIWEPQVRNG